MGFLNDTLGYHKGTEISANFAKDAKGMDSNKKHGNFALASLYWLLSNDEKEALLRKAEERNILTVLQDTLEPIITLYENFPLSFIGKPSKKKDKSALIEIVKEIINKHINKYEMPGMAIQASTMYIRIITGGLKFTNGMKAPDLEKIISDPESEAGKHASGFVRATIMQEFMPAGVVRPDEWAESFWNQGYSIDACSFPWEEDD